MRKWKKRSVELITSLLFGGEGNISVISRHPQKTLINGREKRYFARTIPEKKGISSRRLYNMLCELEGERRAEVHSLMVLRDGEVICECSSDGYSVNEWHVSHSMAKTICGMIIGRLIDNGRLSPEDSVVGIFPELSYRDKKFPLITVEHLLSMTSGVDFAEAGAITERDWTAEFFSSSVKFIPGTKFAYNSMNSYILAGIAERVSGRSFGSLAEEFIFRPLGIENYLWERGPEGTEKGGWGLYMSAESWAKVGYMLLCNGEFGGRVVLSEEWVRKSTETKAIPPESLGSFNYGYHMWTGRNNGEILFNGMLGQNVWISPENRIVAVITSGNNEFFQDSPALEIIRKYLAPPIEDKIDGKRIKLLLQKQKSFFECRRWVRPKERGRGLLYILGLKSANAFDSGWKGILGSYSVVKNNLSIMPLILRVMQNNLDTAIEKIGFYRRGEELVLRILESGEWLTIRVGFYGYSDNVCSIGGEKYILRAMGESCFDVDGTAVYKIQIIFPETANVRMMVVKKAGDGKIRIDLSEHPNHRLAENLISKYSETSGIIGFARDMLERRIGEGELKNLIRKAFNPTLLCVSDSLKNCKEIIKTEENRGGSESPTVKLIRILVERFFKESGE